MATDPVLGWLVSVWGGAGLGGSATLGGSAEHSQDITGLVWPSQDLLAVNSSPLGACLALYRVPDWHGGVGERLHRGETAAAPSRPFPTPGPVRWCDPTWGDSSRPKLLLTHSTRRGGLGMSWLAMHPTQSQILVLRGDGVLAVWYLRSPSHPTTLISAHKAALSECRNGRDSLYKEQGKTALLRKSPWDFARKFFQDSVVFKKRKK